MRHTMAAAIALVAALIATTLLVPGLSAGAPVAPSAAARPAVPTLGIVASGPSGIPELNFSTGLYTGKIFFIVTDTVGTDKSATVTIKDGNASRDGVATPAYTWAVGFPGGGTNYSYYWGNYYLLPINLTYGGHWTITATAGSVTATSTLNVSTFDVNSIITPAEALPAQPLSDAFQVLRSANGAPYTGVTSLTAWGNYTNKTGVIHAIPGTPAHPTPGAFGYWNFTVPTDAMGSLYVNLIAFVTGSGGTTSASSNYSIYIGGLSAPLVSLHSCPQYCGTTTFAAGTPVYVETFAGISGSSFPAAGLTETFKFLHGASFVTMPSNVPTTLTTDAQGVADLSFFATVSPTMFTTHGTNKVSVTLSDPADPSLTDQTTNETFTIYNATSPPVISVSFDHSQYYSGSTATVNWALGGNATVLAGWTGAYWTLSSGSNSGQAAQGTLPTGQTSGSFKVSFPSTFLGTATIDVFATNSTENIDQTATAIVTAGAIVLSPSEVAYQPGDTITVSVSTVGTALNGATLYGTVQASTSGTEYVFNGAVTGGHITINVPNNAAPSDYEVVVVAQSTTGGTLANASVSLFQIDGFNLILGVSSSSSYVDGSFKAGQTVTVDYNLVGTAGYSTPTTFTIYLYPYDTEYTGQNEIAVTVTSASGSFSYTIPSGSPNGQFMVYGETTFPSRDCGGNTCRAYGLFSANVNNNPAALSYQFANSGFTLGGLILVVLAIIAGLVGLFWFMRHRKPTMMMKPETGAASASPSSTSGGSDASSGSSGGSPPSS